MSVILKAPTPQVGPPTRATLRSLRRSAAVLDDIRTNGDSAVRTYSEQFDRWAPESFRLSDAEIAKIVSDLPTTVIDDLSFVQRQVRNFAQAQRDSMLDVEVETLPGVRLGHKHVRCRRRAPTCPVGAIR